jgi:hypothetical protein
MLLHWPTPPTWNRWLTNLLISCLLQAGIFLVFSLFLFPDLGPAGLENENFLGFILGKNTWNLMTSIATTAGALIAAAALTALNLASFRFSLQALFGSIFCTCLNLSMMVARPQVAETWFFYQRSSTFRSFHLKMVHALVEFNETQAAWILQAPILLLCLLAACNIALGFLIFRKQSQRLLKHKAHTMGRPLDTLDKRHSIAGLSLFVSLVALLIFLANLDLPHSFSKIRATSSSSPNVFVIGIDGLGSLDGTSFLNRFASESELQAPFINGSRDPFAIWSEWTSCRLAIRTGRRNQFGRHSKSSAQEQQNELTFLAQKEGYTTLLSTDLTGVFIQNKQAGFQRKISPHLGVSELTENSLLRSVPTLQAFFLATDLKNRFSSALLSDGANSPKEVTGRLIELIDSEYKPGSPVLAMVLLGVNNQEGASELSFLYSNKQNQEKRTEGRYVFEKESYENSIAKVDNALKSLWSDLESRNLLNDSVFVILGMRPKNTPLLGHNETAAALSTSLFLKSSGLGRQYTLEDTGGRLYRSIDLAPTLAKRMMLKSFPTNHCDGESFLDPVDKTPSFPRDQMYGEFSLKESLTTFELQGHKVDILDFLETRTDNLQEFVYAPGAEEFVSQMRTRVWFQSNESLVFTGTPSGLIKTTSHPGKLQSNLDSSFDSFLNSLDLRVEKLEQDSYYIQENFLP